MYNHMVAGQIPEFELHGMTVKLAIIYERRWSTKNFDFQLNVTVYVQ